MLIISGSVRIKEGAGARAAEAAQTMAAATRAEPGCLAYRFSTDLGDPTLVYIYEEWESAQALERHFGTAHMTAFRATLPAIVAGPASIVRYEVSSATPMT